MIDMHYDMLSVIYQCYLRNDYSYIEKWIKNYNSDNVSGLLANLYFMNEEEMKAEIGNREINVLEMFRITTDILKKYLPNTKVIYSIEGCDYIKDTNELEELYKLGLRNILIVWNNPNKYASGNRGDYGLTELGKEFLIKAIDLGISIDMSHMNRKTFDDTVILLKEQMSLGKEIRVIASHSNCYDLYNHERNLTDEQLLSIKEFNPVIGLVSYTKFVGLGVFDYKDMYLQHIKRVVSLLGINCVGVSTDDMSFDRELFDQDFGDMIFDYSVVKKDLILLLKEVFNDEEIEKIMYKNIERKLFMEEVK